MRLYSCPECGRSATVAPWCARPICVHSWVDNVPEVWDGDDAGGKPIEQARNEEFRLPGPRTWAEMKLEKSPMQGPDDSGACHHRNAVDRPRYAIDDEPGHWFCPDCGDKFPLIGDTAEWEPKPKEGPPMQERGRT